MPIAAKHTIANSKTCGSVRKWSKSSGRFGTDWHREKTGFQ